MSRETSHLSIILKKQPLNEGDELITVFTKELGKLRVLARSVKFSRSKLQHGLQLLFLTKLTLAGPRLPKVIGAEVVETFASIRDHLAAAKAAFYALELSLKFSADEQKNEKLFELLLRFFRFLDVAADDVRRLDVGLAKFKIQFLSAAGLAVSARPPTDFSGEVAFSNFRGGFLFGETAGDAKKIHPQTFGQFRALQTADFAAQPAAGDIGQLQEILSDFLRHHLEREIKSERFLDKYTESASGTDKPMLYESANRHPRNFV